VNSNIRLHGGNLGVFRYARIGSKTLSRELRVGLIGLGMMGRNHLRVLRSLSGVKLIGVVDPVVQNDSNDLSGLVCADLDVLIKRGMDYCVVAVPTSNHLEVGLSLAAAGVHALIEKPIAHDTKSGNVLVASFENAGLIAGIGHIERFNAAVQQARLRIAAGDLGDVFSISTRRLGPFPARIKDVGVVTDLATHDIDLTMWISQAKYQHISAFTNHRSERAYEDFVSFVSQLDNGMIATNQVNWLTPFKKREVLITGDTGSFLIDTLSADLTFYENGQFQTQWSEIANFRGVTEGNVIRFAFPKPEPLVTEHESFRDAVLGKPTKFVTLREGLTVLSVAETVLESAKTKRTIEMPNS
jgi:UDP-N-acetylglucosamine 3-dehydrogenase